MNTVLQQFGLDEKNCTVMLYGSGLINNTWLIQDHRSEEKFILQRINHKIFRYPEDIAFNTRRVADYLKQYHPAYLFISPLQTLAGSDLVKIDDAYFRIFPFVNDSHSIDVVEKPEQAFEAAKQFAGFSKVLSGLDASQLKITLPDFHNLKLRIDQFKNSLETGNKERIRQSKKMIVFIEQQKNILKEYDQCKKDFKIRCMHHDCKISNVLFDKDDIGLCVIDLDTLMPGYFISDVGDMMRTYLSAASEDERDLSKIKVRKEFYDAIVKGYLSEMGAELSGFEKEQFHFAGKFMIYMQAIRFLTDYINNDIYYGSKYETQNFERAANQVMLLKQLIEFNPC